MALVIFAVNANPLVKKHPECEFGDLERKCQNVCVDVTELKTEYKEVEDCVKHEICQEVDNCRLVDKCSVEKIPFKVKVTKHTWANHTQGGGEIFFTPPLRDFFAIPPSHEGHSPP